MLRKIKHVIDCLLPDRRKGKEVKILSRRGLTADEVERRSSRICFDEALGHVLSSRNIDLVLDVGANIGDYGLLMRRTGYSGEIFSFEPVEEPRKKLEEHALNDPFWKVFSFAAGKEKSELEMTVTNSSLDFSSFLKPNELFEKRFNYANENNELRIIPIERLDVVLGKTKSFSSATRIFLKTDTQGFDLQVLEGIGEMLSQVAAIQIELSLKLIYHESPHYLKTLQFLEENGFFIAALCPISKAEDGTLIEVDSLMLRC